MSVVSSAKRRRIHEGSLDWSYVYYSVLRPIENNEEDMQLLIAESFHSLLPVDMHDKLSKLISAVACRYNNNSYHNFIHATHVFLGASCLQSNIKSAHFTNVERLAILFAALIHDVDHLGVFNSALVATSHEYALLYNDTNVAEMRSLTLGFELLAITENNFVSFLDKSEYASFRKCVIQLVLATDVVDAKRQKCLNALAESGPVDFSVEANRFMGLCVLLKAADIGSSMQSVEGLKIWVRRFYEEQRNALPAGSCMDTQRFHELQIQYMDGYASTLANTVARSGIVEEGCAKSLIDNVSSHAAFWRVGGLDMMVNDWKVSPPPGYSATGWQKASVFSSIESHQTTPNKASAEH